GLAAAVDGEQCPPRGVVDELRVDVVKAPEHCEARPCRRPAHGAPDPSVPEVARRPPLLRDHFAPAPAFLPTLRRTTSSEYLMPLPLYGSGLRSMRSFAAVWPRTALSAPRSVISVCLSMSTVMPSDRKSTRLNSSHVAISYAVFCLKKKKNKTHNNIPYNNRHL